MNQQDPLADLPWPSATAAPSDACTQAIRGHCTQGLSKRRGLSGTGRALFTLVLSLMLLGFYTYYAVTDHQPSTVMRTAFFGATGWLVASAVLVFWGLARPPGKRGSRSLRLGLVLGVPLLFFGYLAFAAHEHFTLTRFVESHSGAHALGCGGVALFLGALVTAGALVTWRRTDPYSPGLSGALIGMVAGLATGSGMTVACANHEALHAFIAHGLVVFALAGLGFGVGRRLLAP